MYKTSKKQIEEFIRVDHAGERGAIKIYEGQLLALNTIVKDDDLKKIINEMNAHEQEHFDFFETFFIFVWRKFLILVVALGILSSASFWRGNQVDDLPRRFTLVLYRRGHL